MPDCLVCGADNAKQHYGSWCCNGCKGFFWRSVSSKRHYICLNRGSDLECELRDGRRNSCRACRLKRCLEMGMDPNLIRDCWGKTTSPNELRDRSGSLSDQDKPGSAEDRSDLYTPPENGAEKKTLHRILSPYHRDHQQQKAHSPCNLQLLSQYLEWVQGIPELSFFSEEDKNVMILCRARPSAWLLLAHQQLFHLRDPRAPLDPSKLELLDNEVVGPLKELDAHPVEFEMLRNICFFSTVPHLSEEGRRLVNCVQNAYVKALSEFSLKRMGQTTEKTEEEGQQQQIQVPGSLLNSVFRLNRLMHILTAVEKIAHLQE